jgi:hypothetical protein
MSARDIAHALAGRRAQRLADGGYLVSCPVPSHGKGRGDRSPSLHVADGDERLLVHCFAGCDARDVLDELRRHNLIESRDSAHGRPASSKKLAPPTRDNYAEQQHHKAAWLWSRRKAIDGTIAEAYLRKARGITYARPATLGFLPPYKPEHHPALSSGCPTSSRRGSSHRRTSSSPSISP